MPAYPKNRRNRLQPVTLLVKKASLEEAKPPQTNWFAFAGDIVKVAIYVSILGFFLVFTMVRNQTSIFSLNIDPQYYIALGGSLLLVFFGKVVFILLVAFSAILFLLALFVEYRVNKKIYIRRSLELTGDTLRYMATTPFTWVAIYIMAFNYSVNPGELFAGSASTAKPNNTISLIFKEDIDPQTWHLSVDPASPRRTLPIAIIIEYRDSILVKDLTTGAIVKVSNDVIAGILDDREFNPTSLVTLTPTPVASVTATP